MLLHVPFARNAGSILRLKIPFYAVTKNCLKGGLLLERSATAALWIVAFVFATEQPQMLSDIAVGYFTSGDFPFKLI
jgi:hypothetical protein